jgi:hypothetical protein
MTATFDKFGLMRKGLEAPADRHYTIVPSSNQLPVKPRGLFVAVAGNATLVDEAGQSISYPTLIAGSWLPFRPVKVTAATATLIAWY